jgi:peroxiredoxin Q/BCP
MLLLGTPAPDFTLEASTGAKISLNDLQGSYIVLIFYPANDTPVCNRQLEEMSLSASQLLQYNARIFGVNTANAGKAKEYCTRKKLDFPILSDPGGTTAKKYQSFWSWIGTNKRTVVSINPNGKICFYQRGTPTPEQIIEAIQSDQHSAN